jgi:tetraacyldisaccharide 4'-kinase
MLSPLGRIYGKIIDKRNELYEKGSLRSVALGVKTISVGNITVGGTGKTPLVARLAEILAERGENVCIISRGYKRENEKERVLVSDRVSILADARQAGDEPLELAEKLLGKAFVVADANRSAAGLWAKEKFGITVFVLDDAFQHLKVKRDLDIVTVDATNPFGNGQTLPAGILREPLENLRRADLFVITRANLVEDCVELKNRIRQYNKAAPIITSQNKTADLIELKTKDKGQRTQDKFFAFCALGNPDNFFDQMSRENFTLAGTERFPDHHFYTPSDIEKLERKAKDLNAGALLTTAKDAVKLKDLDPTLPVYIARTELVFDDEKKLREMLRAV